MIGSLHDLFQSPTVHEFEDSLQLSHKASDLPIWEELYRDVFPTFTAMVDHREDGEHQRAGIDRSIILANSKQILVDEKIRWKDYGDILLEYWSNEERQVPGWVCKPLRADFIAYAVAPTGRGYLLPVIQLQAAWCRYGQEWIEWYPRIPARNRTYTTVSVGIPESVLWPAIGAGFRGRFTPVEGKK